MLIAVVRSSGLTLLVVLLSSVLHRLHRLHRLRRLLNLLVVVVRSRFNASRRLRLLLRLTVVIGLGRRLSSIVQTSCCGCIHSRCRRSRYRLCRTVLSRVRRGSLTVLDAGVVVSSRLRIVGVAGVGRIRCRFWLRFRSFLRRRLRRSLLLLLRILLRYGGGLLVVLRVVTPVLLTILCSILQLLIRLLIGRRITRGINRWLLEIHGAKLLGHRVPLLLLRLRRGCDFI